MEEMSQFIGDIAPFFWGRPISYVDIGFSGTSVVESIIESRLTIQEVHLVADRSYSVSIAKWKDAAKWKDLQCEGTRSFIKPENIHLYYSSEGHRVKSEVLDTDAAQVSLDLHSQALDSFIESLALVSPSVVKINADVVGLRFLEDAKEWLSGQPLHVLVVEAGLSNKNQQPLPGAFDSLLGECGYRIFKVYSSECQEESHSPFPEKISVVYMSDAFVQNNPYRIVQELLRVQEECQQLQAEKQLLEQESQIAKKKNELLIAQLAQVQERLEEAAFNAATVVHRRRENVNTSRSPSSYGYDALAEILSSFKYCFIDIFVRAIKEPGRNTLLAPYRLLQLLGEEVLIRDAKERRKERLGLISQQCSTEKLVG